MNPRQYEELVSDHYLSHGYQAEITPYSNDYGIDVFATKGKEKIAIQAKMYGNSRKIDRKTVMALHGAKDFFDCNKAVIVTNGTFNTDAIRVAKKLNIEILYLNNSQYGPTQNKKIDEKTFEGIWEKYIIPLKDKVLIKENGESNRILDVNWGGIERLTSNGKKGKINIEIFKETVNKLLEKKFITRDEINQNYPGRASSGIVLILSQIPFFDLTKNPMGLKCNDLGK